MLTNGLVYILKASWKLREEIESNEFSVFHSKNQAKQIYCNLQTEINSCEPAFYGDSRKTL